MRRLYALLNPQTGSSQAFVVLLNPGIALDSWDDPLSPSMQLELSETLDRLLPKHRWLFERTGTSLSELYQDILSVGVWAKSTLTSSERQELTTINAELFTNPDTQTPTVAYQRYLTLKARVDALRAQWNATPEAQRTQEMRIELQEAEEDVNLQGNQARFVALLARRDSLLAKSPARWAGDLLKRYRSDTRTIGDKTYHESALQALDDKSLNASEWTSVALELQGDAAEGQANALPLPSDWRIWQLQTDTGVRWLDSSLTRVALRYEIRAFDIRREWMDGAVFASRAWRWPAGVERPLAGSGDDDILPVLPTQVLMVRNVRVQGNFRQDELADVALHMRSGGSSSWGPFAVSGRYLGSKGFFRARRLPGGFRVDDPQIVALVCQRLGKVPNPDPSLTWGQ